MPVVFSAGGKEAATAVEAIGGQAEAQLGEGRFERGGQAVKGFEFAVLLLLLVISGRAARRVFDELAGQGQSQAGGGQQFGLQDRVEIGDGARGMLLRQALGTMVMTEAQIAGAVDADGEIALETGIVQGFHANEPQGVLMEQLGEGEAADVPDKVIEGFGDRKGILLGARQVVEVVEDGTFQVAQVVVGGAAAAQAQAEEEQAPPAQKPAVIADHGLEAGVGQLVQPAGQVGEEVPDGFEEDQGQSYDLRACAAWQSHGSGSAPGRVG